MIASGKVRGRQGFGFWGWFESRNSLGLQMLELGRPWFLGVWRTSLRAVSGILSPAPSSPRASTFNPTHRAHRLGSFGRRFLHAIVKCLSSALSVRYSSARPQVQGFGFRVYLDPNSGPRPPPYAGGRRSSPSTSMAQADPGRARWARYRNTFSSRPVPVPN